MWLLLWRQGKQGLDLVFPWEEEVSQGGIQELSMTRVRGVGLCNKGGLPPARGAEGRAVRIGHPDGDRPEACGAQGGPASARCSAVEACPWSVLTP